VQCTGLVGTNEKRVPLDNPVDSVIRVVFGGSGPILLSIPLAAPHAGEVGQERKKKPTDRERDLDHPPIVLPAATEARATVTGRRET
jgi:hypothetical protein